MPRGRRKIPYPKKPPTHAARVFRLASLLVEHPTWGYTKLNRVLQAELGMGIRKQVMLRYQRQIKPYQRAAKAITPITVEDALKPHIRKGKEFPRHTKKQMVSGEWRYQWYADIKLVVRIDTKGGLRTRYLKLYMMTGTLLEFNKYVASGRAEQRIKQMIRAHNVGGEIVGWSLIAYFPAKLGAEPV